jgi:hypothetical protein
MCVLLYYVYRFALLLCMLFHCPVCYLIVLYVCITCLMLVFCYVWLLFIFSVPCYCIVCFVLLFFCEISSSHGGEYDVQSCLLGCTAV